MLVFCINLRARKRGGEHHLSNKSYALIYSSFDERDVLLYHQDHWNVFARRWVVDVLGRKREQQIRETCPLLLFGFELSSVAQFKELYLRLLLFWGYWSRLLFEEIEWICPLLCN